MKLAFVSIFAFVIILVVWFFLVSSYFLPKNYSDCLKTRTNDYTRNDLSCSFSPGTPAQQRLCEEKNGVINQFKQCLIIYYNPSFEFPKNLDECVQKIGSTNGQICDLEVNKHGAYDSELTQKLFDDCIKNGGQDETKNISTAGCSIRFQK
jgi:hypothetical protein